MRKTLLIAAAPTLIAAAPRPAMPSQFHGYWVPVAGRCPQEKLAMHGVLIVDADGMTHGETVQDLRAARRVSDLRIGVDTNDSAEGVDGWTSTTLLTLSQRRQRLTYERTRHNGRLLARRRAELYKRCP